MTIVIRVEKAFKQEISEAGIDIVYSDYCKGMVRQRQQGSMWRRL